MNYKENCTWAYAFVQIFCNKIKLMPLILLGITCLLTGCSVFLGISNHPDVLIEKAKAEMGTSAEALPEHREFEKLNMITETFSSENTSKANGRCKYARMYKVYATSLNKEDIFSYYQTQLTQNDWDMDGTGSEFAKVYTRGVNERLAISIISSRSRNPGWLSTRDIDFSQLNESYQFVVAVNLTYIIPQREGC